MVWEFVGYEIEPSPNLSAYLPDLEILEGPDTTNSLRFLTVDH